MDSNQIFIVADDLTGAADCAARCCAHGRSAHIFLAPDGRDCPSGDCAFTSDSRGLPPAEAAQRVRNVIEAVRKPGVLWYKKIDSTLRGNIGSEIDAFIEALEFDLVLLCPAFPQQKRGLREGRLLVDGSPRGGIHLPAILAEQSQYPSHHIALPALDGDPDAVVRQISAGYKQGIKIFTVDAVTEAHLTKIAAAYRNLPYNTLLSGSAGLVGTLAAFEKREIGQPGSLGCEAADRVLIVIGSGSDAASRQVENLMARPDIKVITAGEAPQGIGAPVIALCLPRPAPGAALDDVESRRALDGLVTTARQVMELHQPDLLIVTGGDTAMQLLAGLGIRRLEVRAELLPGIPLTFGQGADGKLYRIILKPGAFGSDSVFGELIALLRRAKHRPANGKVEQ